MCLEAGIHVDRIYPLTLNRNLVGVREIRDHNVNAGNMQVQELLGDRISALHRRSSDSNRLT